jgi:nucleotidyltransferase/DNA polymerase involved in DNA repair
MILHLDGDNFFVSCELLRRRDLVGRAVVVGEERGIATAMNAEAKKLGIARGAPIYKIRKQFGEKEVAILPSHFEMYKQLGLQVLQILEKYSSKIEAYSIDENFCIVPEGVDLEMFAQNIQVDILAATGLWYSCGIARTKALAKIASKRNKPKGICVIMPEDEMNVLETTQIEDVWGIGRRLAPKMRARGIHTGRGYRDAERNALIGIDHKGVMELQDELRGITRYAFGDMSGMHKESDFQQSVETTRAFGFCSRERSFVLSEFSKNVETVCGRLVQLGVAGTSATFFIRVRDHKRIYGECVFSNATQDPISILRAVQKKFEALLGDQKDIMGTGISIHSCVPVAATTSSLFDVPETRTETYPGTFGIPQKDIKNLSGTLGSLQSKYGGSVVHLASSLQAKDSRTNLRKGRDDRDEYVYGLPLVYLGEVA